jgi:hypothetical protein
VIFVNIPCIRAAGARQLPFRAVEASIPDTPLQRLGAAFEAAWPETGPETGMGEGWTWDVSRSALCARASAGRRH